MAYGDHLQVSRGIYMHHGIDRGDGWVIDFPPGGQVRFVQMPDFARGAAVQVVPHTGPKYLRHQIIRRAESRLGRGGWDLFSNNCEHFANWCVKGIVESPQVQALALMAGFILLARMLSTRA